MTLLTIEQVAERLRCSTASVYTMMKQGKIPGWKVANRWVISEARLDSWIREQEAGRSPATT